MISYVLPLQAKSIVNLGTGVRKLRGVLGKVSEKHPHLLTFSPPTDYAWPNKNIFFCFVPQLTIPRLSCHPLLLHRVSPLLPPCPRAAQHLWHGENIEINQPRQCESPAGTTCRSSRTTSPYH